MISLNSFLAAITSILTEKGLNVKRWQGNPRSSMNLLEINTMPLTTILYVKYSNSSPGFWGLTANQIDRLNKSNSKWFVVLLARSINDGYVFSSTEVNKRIKDGSFELSKDGDHKVNESADCGFNHRFKGLGNLIDLVKPTK